MLRLALASAVEAMVASFAPREAATLVVANGVYGERIAGMLEVQSKPVYIPKHAVLHVAYE